MDAELERVTQELNSALLPEDIFGTLVGTPDEMRQAGKKIYDRFARITHPDKHRNEEDKATAGKTFVVLTAFWEAAQQKIKKGIYGDRSAGNGDPVTVHTRKREYVVEGILSRGDFCTLYHCYYPEGGDRTHGVFKVARDPRNNDRVKNEARVLKVLFSDKENEALRPFVSEWVDSFSYRDSGSSLIRQVNVLSWLEGFYSLKEVMSYYPNGVDPRDMAWMWRRLLVALGFAHNNGVIHGAVLPKHVLIHPEKHGLVLVDWSYAVLDPETSGERLQMINSEYEQWYPPEIADIGIPTPGLDIYMGARCMVYLLGGDPVTGNLPTLVPKAIRAFLRGCMLPGPRQRPSDAWSLKEEFDELLERLWGRRRYHPFAIPPRS